MPRRWWPTQFIPKQSERSAPPPSELDVTKAALRPAELEVVSLRRELGRAREELQAHQHGRLQAEHDVARAASSVADLTRKLDNERSRTSELERMFLASVQEFRTLQATATELARLAGASPADVERLREEAKTTGPDPDHQAVGLDRSAPDFLVRAARTAFRKAHHPDARPPHERPAAEAAFKLNEAAFDRLCRKRGMAGWNRTSTSDAKDGAS